MSINLRLGAIGQEINLTPTECETARGMQSKLEILWKNCDQELLLSNLSHCYLQVTSLCFYHATSFFGISKHALTSGLSLRRVNTTRLLATVRLLSLHHPSTWNSNVRSPSPLATGCASLSKSVRSK